MFAHSSNLVACGILGKLLLKIVTRIFDIKHSLLTKVFLLHSGRATEDISKCIYITYCLKFLHSHILFSARYTQVNSI